MQIVMILRAWLPAVAVVISAAFTSLSAHAQSCVQGSWQSPPNSTWDAVNRALPVQAESARFQVRWPANKPNLLTREQATASLASMEKILDWFTGPLVGWPEPFCDTAVKYKIQIFSDAGYGASGAGGGNRTPAMWVEPQVFIGVGKGKPTIMVHEFTHTMQFHSQGLRNTAFGGWLWESHAEFMAAQYPDNPNKVGSSATLAWMPHIYYGSTRNRYDNWQFWDYLKNKYGFSAVNNIFLKSSRQTGQDPFVVLMRNQGWATAQLGDEFGQFAMQNVNWDYIDRQDGFNRGVEFRKAFGPNTDLSGSYKHLRMARLEPIDVANRRFVVSTYYAPQRYGYNLVRLIPDAGAVKITVNFRGVVQKNIAPGAEVGTGANEPGSATGVAMPQDPASNWRWGVVAIDQNGKSRSSPMQRGAAANMDFDLQAGDREVYLVVVATPDQHHSIMWDQKYHTLYRYPYKVELAGALPDGYQSGYQVNVANRYPAGAPHSYGGGWVASNAQVDPGAYVGSNAAVLGGQVRGSARIEDYAVVWGGTVKDNAIVGGLTQIGSNTTVAGNARVRSIMSQSFYDSGSMINDNTILFGDLEIRLGRGTSVSKGVFSGFVDPAVATNPRFGANRTTQPVEVTAVVDKVWPE